jgi:hypothetical protein
VYQMDDTDFGIETSEIICFSLGEIIP